jgi:hypothetical protein
MISEIAIDMGGSGDQVEIPVKLVGCSCRLEDFVLALVKFSNEWKNQANQKPPSAPSEIKPCGCGNAE